MIFRDFYAVSREFLFFLCRARPFPIGYGGRTKFEFGLFDNLAPPHTETAGQSSVKSKAVAEAALKVLVTNAIQGTYYVAQGRMANADLQGRFSITQQQAEYALAVASDTVVKALQALKPAR